MKYALLLALAAGALGAAELDSSWVSYHKGYNYWFAYEGPQRAMRLHPADFGLEHPVRVESLKTEFYDRMGSLDDTVFTFRIYGGDGQTLLWESESLTLHPAGGMWFRHAVQPPVVIDSGDFYIATTHRLLDPWAHPYIRQDSSAPAHSFLGSPGAWVLWESGEYSFYAWACEAHTGASEGGWAGPAAPPAGATLAGRELVLAGNRRATLVDLAGRRVGTVFPGANSLVGYGTGVYFLRFEGATRPRKLVIP